MSDTNPYHTPAATVADSFATAEAYQRVRMLSPEGRMGRVRYIGYSVGLTLAAMLLVMLVGGLTGVFGLFLDPGSGEGLGAAGLVGLGLIALLYLGALVISIFWGIQRLHDLNLSGWWVVTLFVPLINYIAVPVLTLVFWFVPGSKEANRFGAPPEPNTKGPIILAALMPALFVFGILAAIAVPAYQDYLERAAMSDVGYSTPKN